MCASHPRITSKDFHLIFRARSHQLICFDGGGARRWTLDAHGKGVGGSYGNPSGDTPPGLYECERVQRTLASEGDSVWAAYGPWYVWLHELEDQESKRGRAGIGMHGGGSGSPTPLAPKQGWYPTLGCIRLQNEDLPRLVSTIRFSHTQNGRTFLTVTWTC